MMVGEDSNSNNDDQVASGGWVTTSPKYMDKKDGSTSSSTRTHLEGFIPAFSSVKRRGSEGFQQRKNLKAEDLLLREEVGKSVYQTTGLISSQERESPGISYVAK